MFFGVDLTNQVLVIEILEVLLMVQSVALTIQSESKIVKLVNAVGAIFWLVCIIYNLLNCGLI